MGRGAGGTVGDAISPPHGGRGGASGVPAGLAIHGDEVGLWVGVGPHVREPLAQVTAAPTVEVRGQRIPCRGPPGGAPLRGVGVGVQQTAAEAGAPRESWGVHGGCLRTGDRRGVIGGPPVGSMWGCGAGGGWGEGGGQQGWGGGDGGGCVGVGGEEGEDRAGRGLGSCGGGVGGERVVPVVNGARGGD